MSSSSFGYNTSYYSISDIHEDLNVGGAGKDEYEFLSGYSTDLMSKRPMMTWEQWMKWVLFNDKPVPLYKQQQSLEKAVNSIPTNNGKTTWDIISTHPNLTKFAALAERVGYGKFFDEGNTILAPINSQFDTTLLYPLTMAQVPQTLEIPSAQPADLQILRYHILPYMVKPWQLDNRRTRLRTDLELQYVEADWTGDTKYLINPIYQTFGENSHPSAWFPKKSDEVVVLDSIETTNGYLYIIDRPILFPSLF